MFEWFATWKSYGFEDKSQGLSSGFEVQFNTSKPLTSPQKNIEKSMCACPEKMIFAGFLGKEVKKITFTRAR